MGKDGKLYTYKPEAGQDWQDVKEPAGVKGITRVAVSPIGDVLALVGTRSES